MNKTKNAVSESVADAVKESEKAIQQASVSAVTRKRSGSASEKKQGEIKEVDQAAQIALPRADAGEGRVDGAAQPMADVTPQKAPARRRTAKKANVAAEAPVPEAKEQPSAEESTEGTAPEAEQGNAAAKKAPARRRTAKKPNVAAEDPVPEAKERPSAEESTGGAAPEAEQGNAAAKKAPARRRTSAKATSKQAEASDASEAPRAVVPIDGNFPTQATPTVYFPEMVASVKRSFFARIILLLAIVLVFAVSALIYYNRPAVYTEQTDSVNFLYLPHEDRTTIVVNGTVRQSVQGALQLKSQNGHGDVCAAVIGGDLYVISGKSVSKIAEDVTDFVLSAGGDVVVYRTTPSFLYYRKTSDKATASLISRECYDTAYCLSADGKQLVYTAGLGEQAQMRVESYAGTRPYIPTVRGCRPLAVANKCDFVYYLNAEGELVVFDRERNTATAVAQAPDMATLFFNRDFTELLLVENGSTVLIAEGERQSVFDEKKMLLELVPNSRVAERALPNGTQYMTTTFYKSYYLSALEDGLHLQYVDRKGVWSHVSRVNDADTVTVTDKRVFFMLANEHGRTELLSVKVGKSEIVRIDWDVTNYSPNVDGSRVLYTRDENALYLYRPEFGISRMADSIKPETLTVTADDLFCYIDASGALLVSENGGESRVLSDTVLDLQVDAHTLYYKTDPAEDGTYTVFVNYRAERVSKSVSAGVSSVS